MLIIGGVGRLYGAFIGVPLYMIAQDRFSEDRPGLLVFLDRPVDGAGRGLSPAAACSGSVDRLRPRGTGAMTAPALETRGLCKSFGALSGGERRSISASKRGARHALIGPNGAGKTTFVNLVTGALRRAPGRSCSTAPTSPHLPQAARVKRGLVRTFQITALFRGLSVLENVTLAIARADGRRRRSVAPGRRASRGRSRKPLRCSRRLGLADDALRPVATLAYGRQRLIEIAVALGLEPKVLLLDEPAAGVPSARAA